MDIDSILDDYINGLLEKFDNDFTRVANEVNELYFKEINKIYDSFIKQFYSYKTKAYVRHWEQFTGTKKGTNLYYGNQNKIHKGRDPYFEIEYSGDKMAGGYEHNSPEEVLSGVAMGIRGVYPFWYKSWTGVYNSRYFKYRGTLDGAYYTFLEEYDSMMTPVFMRRWKKAGW